MEVVYDHLNIIVCLQVNLTPFLKATIEIFNTF